MHLKPEGNFRVLDEKELDFIAGGDAPGAPGSGLPGQEWDHELGGWVDPNGFGSAFGTIPGTEAWGGGQASGEAAAGTYGDGWILVTASAASNVNGSGSGANQATQGYDDVNCQHARSMETFGQNTLAAAALALPLALGEPTPLGEGIVLGLSVVGGAATLTGAGFQWIIGCGE